LLHVVELDARAVTQMFLTCSVSCAAFSTNCPVGFSSSTTACPVPVTPSWHCRPHNCTFTNLQLGFTPFFAWAGGKFCTAGLGLEDLALTAETEHSPLDATAISNLLPLTYK